MLRRLCVILALLALPLAALADRPARSQWKMPPPWPVVSGLSLQHGDDPAWARPDFDDSGWQRIGRFELPSRDGIYWLRFRITTASPDSLRPRDTLGLSVVASYDVYWDGRLIGRNGRVGSSPADEIPGAIDNTFRIPDELNKPGEHVVALRMSSFHTGFPGSTYGIGPRVFALRDYLAYRTRTTAFSLVAVGGALVVGLVFGLIWLLVDRRAATGWFSLACFAAAAQQALQAWRGLMDYPYSWHYPRLLAITLLIALIAVLLVAFLQSFFRAPGTKLRIAVLLVMLAAIWPVSPLYNIKGTAIAWAALSFALAITLEGWWRRRRGASYIFAGLALSVWGLMSSPSEFLEHSFVFSSGATMLGCVIALALQLRDEHRAARQAQLTAARLEIELLKKNIQPHFVLNTLATIMEVVEQEPKSAVALIDALASEFRLLNRVAGEKLVPLAQELELCRAHLRVMSLRKAARCEFQVHGVDESARVPPALFLTLVENGLTHLLPREGQLRFELRCEHRGGIARYVFLALGARQPGEPVGDAGSREGTGLRYIKARLEESFTGRWTLRSAACEHGWQTVIEMPAAGPARLEPTSPAASRLRAAEKPV